PTHTLFFLSLTRRPPRSTPFPYTTLFRSLLSHHHARDDLARLRVDDRAPVRSDGDALLNDTPRRFFFDPHQRRIAGALSPRQKRSEEHTSELQSRENLVCRLLLEKKKMNT